MPRGGKRPGAGRRKGSVNAVSAAKREATEAALSASGLETPLNYMLRVLNDPTAELQRRDDMAKAAAPYQHAKFSSVEVGGTIIDKRSAADWTNAELVAFLNETCRH
jgi:hypothetical protein